MGRQLTRLAAIVALLAGGAIGQAQEFVPSPVIDGCNSCQHRHDFSLKRLWDWATYRPLRVPVACQCHMCQLTPTPPLYMYFIGEFGPRSPSLGYPVWDQGYYAFAHPDHCGH